MKVLIIESTPASPHAETSLEIGIKEKMSGSDVVYCPIFHLMLNVMWMSNINGNNSAVRADTVDDWLAYLVNLASKFSEVDVFSLKNIPCYLTSEIKNNLFGFEFCGQPLGLLVRSNSIELTGTSDLDFILDNHRDLCEGLAQTAIMVYELAIMLIRKHEPDCIYIFNGRTPGSFPVYLAAKQLGVKLLIHERGPHKDFYTIWEDPPQYLTVFKQAMNVFSARRSDYLSRMSAANFYCRQRIGRLSGFGIVNKQDHDADLDLVVLSDKFVVFFTSSNHETEWMPLQDFSNELGTQIDAVECLKNACIKLGVQLVIKMHPNTPESEKKLFDKFCCDDNCIIIEPNSKISSHNLAKKAFRNFSFGSTLTWELIFSGVHCAVLSDSYGRGEKGVFELRSLNEIIDYIRFDLPPIDRSFAIKYGDFVNGFGERYDFYRAHTLFSGTFDLNLSVADI